MMHRVLLVIFLRKSAGSIFKVSSISVNTGIAPTSNIASHVATKVNPWVMTSSPGPTPRAMSPTFSAAVPEVTA